MAILGDPGEIVMEYRTAKNKTKQIQILAELNCCSVREIAQLLSDKGEELPKNWVEKLQKPARKPRKKKKSKEGTAEMPEEKLTEKDQKPDPNVIPERKPEKKDEGKAPVTRTELVELLARVLPEEKPAKRDGFTADEIKTAAFDLISEEVAAKGCDEDRLGRVVIALAAYRSLIERLTGEGDDGKKEEG